MDDLDDAKEELKGVVGRIKEIEGKIAAWEDDPDGEFANLKPGKQRSCKDADGYLAELKKELSEMRAEKASLNYKIGGQSNVYARVKRARLPWCTVDIALTNSNKYNGVRQLVHEVAEQTDARVLFEGPPQNKPHKRSNEHQEAVHKMIKYVYDKDGTATLTATFFFLGTQPAVQFRTTLQEQLVRMHRHSQGGWYADDVGVSRVQVA